MIILKADILSYFGSRCIIFSSVSRVIYPLRVEFLVSGVGATFGKISRSADLRFLQINLSGTHLIDERCESVVQGLDLLFLLGADRLDGGVDLHVQRGQQALVHSHCCDGGHHIVSHATCYTSSKTYVAILKSPYSVPSPTGHIPTDHFKPPSAHCSSTAAQSPIGATDSKALPATTHTIAAIA